MTSLMPLHLILMLMGRVIRLQISAFQLFFISMQADCVIWLRVIWWQEKLCKGGLTLEICWFSEILWFFPFSWGNKPGNPLPSAVLMSEWGLPAPPVSLIDRKLSQEIWLWVLLQPGWHCPAPLLPTRGRWWDALYLLAVRRQWNYGLSWNTSTEGARPWVLFGQGWLLLLQFSPARVQHQWHVCELEPVLQRVPHWQRQPAQGCHQLWQHWVCLDCDISGKSELASLFFCFSDSVFPGSTGSFCRVWQRCTVKGRVTPLVRETAHTWMCLLK